jgi:ketosteroid isomerase-like protein
MKTNAESVKAVYDAFRAGDVAAVLGALHPEIQWNEAEGFVYDDGNPYVGPQAVAEGVFMRLGADLEGFVAAPTRVVESGDTVLVEGRYRGTVKATGAQIDAQFAHVWQVRDGKMVRFQQYTDTKQWAQATRR